jgi:hypothetical protein
MSVVVVVVLEPAAEARLSILPWGGSWAMRGNTTALPDVLIVVCYLAMAGAHAVKYLR